MKLEEKGDGFPGQRIVVLPRSVAQASRRQPLTGGLLPTDAGYFPRAKGHRRERARGVDQAIFIYCIQGAGSCEMGGRRHPVRVGDLLVIPPDVPHRYEADPVRPWSICWFHAHGLLMRPFLMELEATVAMPVIRLGESPQLVSLFEEILEVLEHGYAQNRLLYAAQTLGHLLAVTVRLRRGSSLEQPDTRSKVSCTIDYMKQHLDRALRLDTLAALASLSRSQYAVLFKQQTGYAPLDYFTRLRIHRACQLLDTTPLNIKVIAAKIGYDDPLYFSRVFHQVNDVSPLQYRRLRKG